MSGQITEYNIRFLRCFIICLALVTIVKCGTPLFQILEQIQKIYYKILKRIELLAAKYCFILILSFPNKWIAFWSRKWSYILFSHLSSPFYRVKIFPIPTRWTDAREWRIKLRTLLSSEQLPFLIFMELRNFLSSEWMDLCILLILYGVTHFLLSYSFF